VKVNTLSVLNAIINGGMTGRLFQEIREKIGLVYTMTTHRLSYKNTGLFAIYSCIDPIHYKEVIKKVLNELYFFAEKGIHENELNCAKNKVINNFCFNMESIRFRMARLSQSEMYYGYVPTTAETIGSIYNVTIKDIENLTQKIFTPQTMTLVAIGPI